MLKQAVRRVASQLGVEITRNRGAEEGIRPLATHAPWLSDAAFLSAYEQIRNNTMVDIYRCYELWTLVEQVASLPGDIVEIGVWRGGSGAILAQRALSLSLDATVYLCDTFRGMVKTGEHDPLYRGGELSDTSRNVVAMLCEGMNLHNVRILEGIFPEETGEQVTGDAVRLCHIDVDVYQSAEDIVTWVWPKMPVGALLVYDDYGFPTCAGITKHVDDQRTRSDRLVIHNLNGHAIIVKLR